MKKSTKLIAKAGALLLTTEMASLLAAGYWWGWGPFAKLHDSLTAHLPGNAAEYDLAKVSRVEGHPLAGKKVLFLGSSVTFGAASQGISFVDYLEKITGCIAVKRAVSGTTLVEEGRESYVSRLRKVADSDIDLVICQLSTNDASQGKELGQLSDSIDYTRYEDFDTHTIAGALDYITAYSKNKWHNCDVILYTNPHYDSEAYAKMVDLAQKWAEKWHSAVLDLWNDQEFNRISEQKRSLYMADPIHPTKAGYLRWWTPFLLQKLEELLSSPDAEAAAPLNRGERS